MTSYHEFCFTELHKIMMNKITFVGFRGDDRLNCSPPWTRPWHCVIAQLRTLERKLLVGFPVQRIAT